MRTTSLRQCISDELKSVALFLRTAGPGGALIGFESQIIPTKLEKSQKCFEKFNEFIDYADKT